MVARRWPACISDSGGRPRVRIQHKGKIVFNETLNVKIDTKSGLAEAVRLRDEVKHRLALGLAINEQQDSEKHIFWEAAQEYMNQLSGQLSTHLDYESAINSWWMPVLANCFVEDITTKDIRKVLNAKSVSAKRKRNVLIPLRGIFDYLDIRPNPAHFKIKKTEQPAVIERYLPDERSALLSALEGENRVYFALLFGCGFRPAGEPLGLHWTDYNDGMLHVHQTVVRRKLKATTKTYVARKVVVPEWVKPILENHPTRFEGGPIFVNSRGSFYKDSDKFNQVWRLAHEATGIRYRIPYVCRHTRAAELLSTGVEPVEAAKQLGHSLEMFNRIYSEFIEAYCQGKDPARFNGLAPSIEKLPKSSQTGKVIAIKCN